MPQQQLKLGSSGNATHPTSRANFPESGSAGLLLVPGPLFYRRDAVHRYLDPLGNFGETDLKLMVHGLEHSH